MNEKLTNQTIRHILKDIQSEVKEIKGFVSLTNGRVRSLELWRARILGALAIISLVLLPIIGQYLTKIAIGYFK